jgi:hypothetical protein
MDNAGTWLIVAPIGPDVKPLKIVAGEALETAYWLGGRPISTGRVDSFRAWQGIAGTIASQHGLKSRTLERI